MPFSTLARPHLSELLPLLCFLFGLSVLALIDANRQQPHWIVTAIAFVLGVAVAMRMPPAMKQTLKEEALGFLQRQTGRWESLCHLLANIALASIGSVILLYFLAAFELLKPWMLTKRLIIVLPTGILLLGLASSICLLVLRFTLARGDDDPTRQISESANDEQNLRRLLIRLTVAVVGLVVVIPIFRWVRKSGNAEIGIMLLAALVGFITAVLLLSSYHVWLSRKIR